MPSPTYRISILGCRVNHAEVRELESILINRGLVPSPDDQAADLEVVHTCTVTNTASAKSRQAVRRAMRRRGGAPGGVIVTGCYASSDPEEAAGIIGDPTRVITHADPHGRQTMTRRFELTVDEWLSNTSHHQAIRIASETSSGQILPLPVIPPQAGAGSHIRAELKIQDGCDAHCTFCILPKIRPVLRSKTTPEAVAEARQLVDLGHREIVLSGIFIGAYGHETALRRRQQSPGPAPLADLLDAVAQVPGLQRLRISSMEPGDVDSTLLDAILANRPVVVPHLHLPLQSGSDRILRRMNRQYLVGDYLEMIDQVREALTDPARDDLAELPPAITTDIICGFPGETEDDFAETLQVARRVGYLHMHVFPFSPKRGTAAARWSDQFVDAPIAQQRVRTLIDLEQEPHEGFSIAFRRRLLGREVRVMIEQPDRDAPGWMIGRCDHYALVHVQTDVLRGTLSNVLVDEVTATRTSGTVVASRRVGLPVLTSAHADATTHQPFPPS